MAKDTTVLNLQMLNALNDAALAISGELSLEKALQLIVDVTRDLVSAEYAALGVPNAAGGLDAFIHSGIDAELVGKMGSLPRGKGVLGAIIREKRPFRLKNIADHERSVGFPPHHPPMDSFLGVPILGGTVVYGNLYLTNKMGADEFSEQDETLVKMLAAHAAIAIQNARLYEQVERLAVLEERTRIGMDLHDGVIQSIYAVGLTLESARISLPEGTDDVNGLLETAVFQLNHAIQDIRNFIMDLRPRRFRGELRQGLAQLVREFQANTMIPVDTNITGKQSELLATLPFPVARTIFLTTQEALANIARHAEATQVDINLHVEDDVIILELKDNGKGFDMGNSNQKIGHGLSNMEIRAQERGGTFKIASQVGNGTTIILSLPVKPVN